MEIHQSEVITKRSGIFFTYFRESYTTVMLNNICLHIDHRINYLFLSIKEGKSQQKIETKDFFKKVILAFKCP